MADESVLLELTFEGWQFTEDDLTNLRESFADVGPIRVTGGWAPAAVPAATVELALTFVGQAFVAVVAEKALERAWRKSVDAWKRYRNQREAAGLEQPELVHIAVRPSGFDIEINGSVNVDDDLILDVLELMAERQANGQLAGMPIRRISLPCREDEGYWQQVYRQEYADTGDYFVWHVESRAADPMLGFYNARTDQWL